jgi:catechol-2,3-dioxygenase
MTGTLDETKTGLDPIGTSVPNRSELDAWASRLDAQNVARAGVTDTADPVKYSALVFRDPDNIQLEMFHMEA